MGIVRAAIDAIGGGLADQWLEVIEPFDMSDATVMSESVKARRGDRRNSNTRGTDHTVSNGSVIQVYPDQFMLLVDGGRVVDYTAEEGYYTVDNAGLPSLFNGQFTETLKETFSRIMYAGVTPGVQKVYYINLREIRGIKFGTPNPLNYFDAFYNAELYLRAFGTYSIKITDPLKFFMEAVSCSARKVDINDINMQYLSEFLSALQAAINKMSADGIRISHVASRSRELGGYMADILDAGWNEMRGMQVQSVGIANISYDDESRKLLAMRSEGAMLGDPAIREGYVQGAVARGLEAAGANDAGATNALLGMGIGLDRGYGFIGATSDANRRQLATQGESTARNASPSGKWTCACGTANAGKFCTECGTPQTGREEWTCACTTVNTGKFCTECGGKRPGKKRYRCDKCGYVPEDKTPRFCPECGDAFGEEDEVNV